MPKTATPQIKAADIARMTKRVRVDTTYLETAKQLVELVNDLGAEDGVSAELRRDRLPNGLFGNWSLIFKLDQPFGFDEPPPVVNRRAEETNKVRRLVQKRYEQFGIGHTFRIADIRDDADRLGMPIDAADPAHRVSATLRRWAESDPSIRYVGYGEFEIVAPIKVMGEDDEVGDE